MAWPDWNLGQYQDQPAYDDSYTDPFGGAWGSYGDPSAWSQNQPYQAPQPWGNGPWSLEVPGQATQYGGGAFQTFGGGGGGPQRPAGVPSNFVYYAPTDSWRSPDYAQLSGGGGGTQQGGYGQSTQGGMPQYNAQQDQITYQREALAAQIQQNQAYQSYLTSQLAQQGKTAAEQAAIERERIQIEREAQALRAQQFELEKQADEFKRAMQVQDVLSNPRSLVQSLMLLGASPAQAAGYLQSQPLAQQLGAAQGTGQLGGWAPPAGGTNLQSVMTNFGGIPNYNQLLQSASGAGGAYNINPQTGRNDLFPFIEGRKLPVQQTLQDLQTNNPRAQAIASLASFSGQDPNAFYGEFQSYLPKGSTLGPAAVR